MNFVRSTGSILLLMAAAVLPAFQAHAQESVIMTVCAPHGFPDGVNRCEYSPTGTELVSVPPPGHQWSASIDGSRFVYLDLFVSPRVFKVVDRNNVLLSEEGVADNMKGPVMAPSGQAFAFVESSGVRTLFVRDIEQDITRPLATDVYNVLAWSPDDAWVVYIDMTSTLRRIRTDGTGSSVLIRSIGHIVVSVDWSYDGTRLAVRETDGSTSRIYTITPDGGTPVTVYEIEAPVPGVGVPHWSPDGEKLAFTRRIKGSAYELDTYELYTISSSGGSPQTLVSATYATAGASVVYGVVEWFRDGGAELSVSLEPDSSHVVVGDTLSLKARIRNEGTLKLTDVQPALPIELSTEDGAEWEAVSGPVPEVIAELDAGETDSLTWTYVATATGSLMAAVSIEGTAPDGSMVTAEADTTVTIEVRKLVVNSVEDTPLDPEADPLDGMCDTGESVDREGTPESECTLRAAMQVAAAAPAIETEITFDIPGGASVHRIAPEESSYPAATGAISLIGPNADDAGVEIDGSSLTEGAGFQLGGSGGRAFVKNLAFYGFPGDVIILNGDLSSMTGSYVGSDWAESYLSTDPDVTEPLRNGGTAVLVRGDVTTIGGTSAEANLIIGSHVGVRVENADDVAILGNAIGVLESPHASHGVDLVNADGVEVGSAGEGNTILFNLGYGIRVDEATSGMRIQGNTITRSRMDAILVQQGSTGVLDNMIGGPGEDEGNIIERSIGAGIRITGPSDATPNQFESLAIQGNILRQNEEVGIRLKGGSHVLIGGETGEPGSGAGNDIRDGIEFDSGYASWIRGNRIARLDPETEYSEEGTVVSVKGIRNTIGGESSAAGNVIYGVPVPGDQGVEASGIGILDEGTSTTIQRNFVGNDGSGALPLMIGIELSGTEAEVLENTISGNADTGLSIQSTAVVEGNYIGTTATGNGAMPNGAGVQLAVSMTLGGLREDDTCERPCNVISGNDSTGVIVRRTASGASIQGNFIGMGVDGLTPVGNGKHGMLVLGDNVTIGGDNDIELGDCLGPCNWIAANAGDGIRTFLEKVYRPLNSNEPYSVPGAGLEGAGGLDIRGNFIGTGGQIPGAGNAGSGIALGGLGDNSRIGDLGTGGNHIAGNGGAGVLHLASTASFAVGNSKWRGGTGNSIRGNRIMDNTGEPIDLVPNYRPTTGDGWTTLDPGDEDNGPNTMLNWPYLIQSRDADGGSPQKTLLVLWTGDPDAPPATYTLDVYTAATCEGVRGDAENYLLSRELEFPIGSETDLDAVTVDVQFLPSKPNYITTFTDSDGNTSEFGNCRGANQTPQQAIASLEPGIRQQVNELLIQLNEPADPGKRRAAQQLLVLQSDLSGDSGTFEASVATAPSGTPVAPMATLTTLWEIVPTGRSGVTRFDVCLSADGLADAEDLVVLGRGPASNGEWRPFDTRLETVDDVVYACADRVNMLQLSLGSGSAAALAAPTLQLPIDGSVNVPLDDLAMSWSALTGAATYDVEMSLSPVFGSSAIAATGLTATDWEPTTTFDEQQHHWRVRGVSGDGVPGPWSVPFSFTTAGIPVDTEGGAELPERVALAPNYPNPFNPQTTIGFALPESGHVRLRVFDLLGREVALLVDAVRSAGRHEVRFDASGLPSGVYLYRIDVGGLIVARRMVLMK